MRVILLLILALSATLPCRSHAAELPWISKIGTSLTQQMKPGRKEAPFPVIVILKQQADLSHADSLATRKQKGRFVYDALRKVALRSQIGIVNFLSKSGADFQRFYIMNMVAVYNATPALVRSLASRSDVSKIISNPAIRLQLPLTLPAFRAEGTPSGPGKNIVATGAVRVWNEFHDRGKGIVVAGADTGVDWQHPALKSHYRGFDGKHVDHNYNWHDAIHRPILSSLGKCGINSPVPCDDYDHGTHTMGTMVGDDGAGNEIGMAPDAKWIACRNMDQGTGRPTTYLECFEFFLAPYAMGANPMTDGKPSLAPNIINNSWGCPASEGCEGSELLPAVQALIHSGIMVVVSAGNDGPGCATIDDPPAMYSGAAFTVGAYDHRTNQIASFSSRGPSTFDGGLGPDLAAPGVSIRSSVPGGGYEQEDWSGTSMAGPHVAGAIALLWSANPRLIGMIPATEAILENTARPAPTTESCGGITAGAVPNDTYGYGLLDAYHAVRSQKH